MKKSEHINFSGHSFTYKKVLVFIIYFSLATISFIIYRYQINPDGISYISIAKKYLNKDISNAINGYWGPLFSWLLLPFLSLNLNELISIKILSIIIGAFTLGGAYLLGRSFGLKGSYNDFFVILLIFPISYYALRFITPDLLMLCLLCFYLAEIYSDNYNTNNTKGIRCGFWGALIYFAKYYGFPFFLVHYLIV